MNHTLREVEHICNHVYHYTALHFLQALLGVFDVPTMTEDPKFPNEDELGVCKDSEQQIVDSEDKVLLNILHVGNSYTKHKQQFY